MSAVIDSYSEPKDMSHAGPGPKFAPDSLRRRVEPLLLKSPQRSLIAFLRPIDCGRNLRHEALPRREDPVGFVLNSFRKLVI